MRQKFRQESLYAVFGHEPTQIPMILQRDRLNDSADQIGDHSRPRDRHVRSIQPFPGCLLQATPGQRRVGSLVNVFGESLFDTRIKLAQSPLLNGPTLVFESVFRRRYSVRSVAMSGAGRTNWRPRWRSTEIGTYSSDLNVVPVIPTKPSCSTPPIQFRDRNVLRML